MYNNNYLMIPQMLLIYHIRLQEKREIIKRDIIRQNNSVNPDNKINKQWFDLFDKITKLVS